MSNLKGAEGYRRFYQDISGNLTIVAGTGDTTLVTVRNANSTIFIQRIVVYITTDAAQSAAFEDSNGTAKKIAEVTTSPGDETRWEFFFGDRGEPLTEGKNFVLNVSAAGLAANISWEGYSKITSAVAAGSTN
jgi:hypothetical protein